MDKQMNTNVVLEFIACNQSWDIMKKRQLIQKLKNEQKLDMNGRYRVLFLAVQWLASSQNRANIVVPLGAEVIKSFGSGHPHSLSALVKKKLINALWAMDQGGYVDGAVDRQVEIVNVTHWILSQLVEEDDSASYELCNQVRLQLANFLTHCNPSRLGPALAVSRLIKAHPCCLFSKEHIVKGDSNNEDGVCEEVGFDKNDEDEELEMKVCEALIKSIGALTIPTPDIINLETFAGQVREVAEAVALIWRRGRQPSKGKHGLEEEEKRVFQCLQIIHSLVSDSGKEWRVLCPALASILQLVPLRLIPGAVSGVLGSGNGSVGAEGTVAALLCNLLCDWLLRWPGATNLSHWILALLQGLAPSYPPNTYSSYSSHDTNNNRRISQAACESRVRILVTLTITNIEKLVEGLNDPSICHAVLPVVSHMLLGFQHSPVPFLRVCPHLPPLLSRLRDDREDGVPGSAETLQHLVDLCSMLLFLHGGSDPTRQHLKEALEECPLPSMGVPNHEYLLRLRWMPMSSRTYGSYEYSLPPQIPSLDSSTELTPTVYHTSSRAGHIGLSNLGNTCYANSVLQALFMTTRFRRRVLLSSAAIPPSIGTMAGPSLWGSGAIGTWGRVTAGSVPPPKTRPVLSQLRLLFALLSHSPRPALSPQAILGAANMAGGHFEVGQQHDCSEFMCFFLDSLHEQGKAYAQHLGKDSEEEIDDDKGMIAVELEKNDGDGESEEKANSTQEEEEDADMDEDEGEEEDMQEGHIGMKRWTTEEDLSSSEGRRLQTKRKALSLAEFSSVAAAETDSGQDADEKISEVVEGNGIAQSGAQALSDSHSDSTDSGIQSVGEEDVTAVMSATANLQANEERGGKAEKQPSESGKGIKKGSLWAENGDVGKLKKEFCSLVQQEFGGVAHTMHQCLSCGSVSVRADPFRDLQLAFPEDPDEVTNEIPQEAQGFIGPQLPQHMLPASDVEKDEKEGKDLEKSKDDMEVEDKVSSVKKRHSGPWGVSDLLGHYLSTETLRGENRYRCTKCKGLQDARRSVSLAWPPPRHLLLTLKHFRFDRNTARRSKALRPLRVELSLEVPVALSRSHRSNAAKRRKTRSAQTSSEEDNQEKKIHTSSGSAEESSSIEIKDTCDKEDGIPSCSNVADTASSKENGNDGPNAKMPLEKSGSDSNVDEGEGSGTQESVDGSNFSRRRRRVRREEEGASVGRDERLYVEERRVTYHLYAAIVHSGFSLDGGHYYTYARRPQVSDGVDGEEEWCMLNDRQVSPQSGPESFSEPSGHRPQDTPYVLFYMLEGMNSVSSPDWWSLPVELRDAVEADGSKYVREEEDWRWKHSSKTRPSGGFNRRDGDDPPPSSCGGGMGGGFSSMGGHFVF